MIKKIFVIYMTIILFMGCINDKNSGDESNNHQINNETSSVFENNNSLDEDIDTEELNLKLGNAAFDGDLEKVQEYIKRGADINYQEPLYGTSALYLALKNNHKEIAKYLIEQGANVNIMTYDKETPLSTAIIFSNFEMVKYLIQKKADVNALLFDNETALIYAIYIDSIDIVKLLLTNGANVNIKFLDRAHSEIPIEDAVEKTLLQYAKEKGNQEIINLLIEAGATE